MCDPHNKKTWVRDTQLVKTSFCYRVFKVFVFFPFSFLVYFFKKFFIYSLLHDTYIPSQPLCNLKKYSIDYHLLFYRQLGGINNIICYLNIRRHIGLTLKLSQPFAAYQCFRKLP